jgi:hypothetical protein
MVSKKNIYIFNIILAVIILSIIVILFIVQKHRSSVQDNSESSSIKEQIELFDNIEEKLNIVLPTDSSIIYYDPPNESGDFAAKIMIKPDDLSYVRKQVDDFFIERSIEGTDLGEIHFINSHKWWDLNKDDISVWYNTFTSDEVEGYIYSYHIFIFITNEVNGNYYLYIVY